MTLEAAYRDERGNIQTVECSTFKEGENGLTLVENPGKNVVGYIPYDNLERVTPKSS
ncbi:hypothetical protein [Haloarcula halophila]|uniref:hypothetical protein n=1 Tax=Haloarcula TaxID=2237 RepID=UPI0023E46CD7|nr:hypothetical protein [Halomicroarcula sp. DFY41]